MHLVDEDNDMSAEINIVPMIDVIFAILAFFIIASLFLTRNEGLPVNLPQAATAQTQREAEITVTVEPGGEIALNRNPVELDRLEAAIRDIMPSEGTALVILKADEAVSHGQVVKVMDRLRRLERATLAIATEQPETDEE
jgi:biopolymer transport protein ExbD